MLLPERYSECRQDAHWLVGSSRGLSSMGVASDDDPASTEVFCFLLKVKREVRFGFLAPPSGWALSSDGGGLCVRSESLLPDRFSLSSLCPVQ